MSTKDDPAQDPRLTALAASLPASVPFVGPEAQERQLGRPFLARIGANESVFGPSPKAAEAMSRAAAESWMYGDPECHDLRHAIAEHHGIAAENVVVGEGIDGLLGYLVRLTVAPGDTVVTSDGAYPTFNYHVTGFGGVLHRVPYRDDAEDLPALTVRAAATGARLIYVANPDNPMGSWHNSAAVAAAIATVPAGCLLIDPRAEDFCAQRPGRKVSSRRARRGVIRPTVDGAVTVSFSRSEAHERNGKRKRTRFTGGRSVAIPCEPEAGGRPPTHADSMRAAERASVPRLVQREASEGARGGDRPAGAAARRRDDRQRSIEGSTRPKTVTVGMSSHRSERQWRRFELRRAAGAIALAAQIAEAGVLGRSLGSRHWRALTLQSRSSEPCSVDRRSCSGSS